MNSTKYTDSVQIRKALQDKVLMSFDTKEELITHLTEIKDCEYLKYTDNLYDLEYFYHSEALIKLANLAGIEFHSKLHRGAKSVILYDFVRDCIPYFKTRGVGISELEAEYTAEEVFRAKCIIHTFHSKMDTLRNNVMLFEDFRSTFQPYKLFNAVFADTNSEALADMYTEDVLEYLSTCDVDRASKDVITALFTAIQSVVGDRTLRKYAIEDVFINQQFIVKDTRIPALIRAELALVQILVYDNELSYALQVGWSNAIDGKYVECYT